MKNRIFWVIADLESAATGSPERGPTAAEPLAFPWALFGALGAAELKAPHPATDAPPLATTEPLHTENPAALAHHSGGSSSGNSIVELTRLRRLLAELEELELYGEAPEELSGGHPAAKPVNRAFKGTKDQPETP